MPRGRLAPALRSLLLCVAIGIGAALAARPVSAQPPPDQAGATDSEAAATRADLLRRARQAKAATLSRYEPGRLERWALAVERGRWVERWFLADGFYPRVGTLAPASGLAVGAGFRTRRWWDRRLHFVAGGAVSPRGYGQLDANLEAPELAGGRAFVGASARRSVFPEEDFFGLGPDSRRQNRVKFLYRESRVGGAGGVRLASWLTLGGGTARLAPRATPVPGGRFPSIEARFTAADAPGLTARPAFLHHHAFFEVNFRDPRGNPRRGGLYRAGYHAYLDRTGGRYSFRRLELEAQQYLSAFHDRRVVALRGRASFSETDAGRQVPFYLQETLGGPSTLRGFRSYRFRDRQLLLLQAEYRWEIFPALDAALFYDAGMVAPRQRGLSLNRVRHDYGVGFRFGTRHGVFLRIDSAFGSSDGPHLYIVFDHVF